MVTGLLTGHCPLRSHLARIGVSDDTSCRLCLEEEESAEHILCECEALAYSRMQHLGKAITTPGEVAEALPKSILGFVRSLRSIWEI